MLAANLLNPGTWFDQYFDLCMMYRGPDGVTKPMDSTFFYVPEPVSCALMMTGALALLRRRRAS